MSLGRYFSARDLKLINSLNGELMGDIIQNTVLIFKIASEMTKTNIYGESAPDGGKFFYPGVEVTMLRESNDITTEKADFGPDRSQTVAFKFRENMLKLVNIYPEIGDIIFFNERYHEIDNVVQEQFIVGQPDKSHSIICNTHYSRLSKLSLIKRQF